MFNTVENSKGTKMVFFTIAECTYDAGQQVVEERTRYPDKRYEQIIASSVKNYFSESAYFQDICTVYALSEPQ